MITLTSKLSPFLFVICPLLWFSKVTAQINPTNLKDKLADKVEKAVSSIVIEKSLPKKIFMVQLVVELPSDLPADIPFRIISGLNWRPII